MVHACNPSYLRGADWKNPSSQPTRAKSEAPILTNIWELWYMIVIPSYEENVNAV
jgi:hypothetical protein